MRRGGEKEWVKERGFDRVLRKKKKKKELVHSTTLHNITTNEERLGYYPHLISLHLLSTTGCFVQSYSHLAYLDYGGALFYVCRLSNRLQRVYSDIVIEIGNGQDYLRLRGAIERL